MPVPARMLSALSFVGFAILLDACSALPKSSLSPASVLTGPSAPEAYNLASQAIKARDYPSAIRYLAHADSLAPAFAPIILQKARAHVLYLDTAGALRELDRIAELGHGGDLAADSLLRPFSSLPEFGRAAARAAINATPIVSSDTSFVIRESGGGVEGMTHWTAPDGTTSFYLGAMKSGSGRILRIDAQTSAVQELVAGVRGTFMGMHPDSRSRLWVAHTQVDTIAGIPRRRSGIRSYSLTTGELVREYPFTDPSRDHWFNDLAVARDGRVYVTDSDAGIVYVLDAESGSFSMLVPGRFDFSGPNGLTLSGDERVLYVSALEGIFRVDLRTAKRLRLSHPAAMSTGYSDGLYACGGGLIGVQTVGDYARVVFFQLNRQGDAIVSGKVLERRHPEFRAPSTGTITGDEFHYIARRGRLKRAGADSSSALVLRLPLQRLCIDS